MKLKKYIILCLIISLTGGLSSTKNNDGYRSSEKR